MNKTLGLGLLALLLTACSPITADNYAKLHTGMTMAEVQAVLGKPAQCTDIVLLKQCRWGDEKRNISVSFAGDAAITSSLNGL